MRTKNAICRGQVRIIEDAVETWKADHASAMVVRDVEDVLRCCVFLADLLAEWEKEAWAVLFSARHSKTQETGNQLRKMQAYAIDAFRGVTEWVDRVAAQGHEVEGAAQFAEAFKALERRQERFARRWPFITEADVALGMAQIARGAFVSAEELERELLG